VEDFRVNRTFNPGLDICKVLKLVFIPMLFSNLFFYLKIIVLKGIKYYFNWFRFYSFFWTSKLFVLGKLFFKTRILELDLV